MIQLQVLNYILNTKDKSVITLNNLTKDYFSEYEAEFEFIKNHLEKFNQICDTETFLATFPDFNLFVVNEPISYLLDELLKDFKTRKLAESFNNVKNYLLNDNYQKAITTFNNTFDSLSKIGIAVQSVDILKDKSRYDEYIAKAENFNKFYLSTGFQELDNLIGGIDRQEELGLIVARSGKGKSWFLLKLATAAVKSGLQVGLYSGEMSVNKVGYRVDTLLSHLSNGALMHGNANIKEEYQTYLNTLINYQGSLKVLTPSMLNGYAKVSDLQSFVEKEKLDILFIDQISLLNDDKKAKNPVEKISNISKDLKNLQVIKKIPIISVVQQNRTKNDDDTTIDTNQVALGDRLAQDATFILGLMRDKKDNTIMKIIPVKLRDGASNNELQYKVDFNTGTFIYIPNEENADVQDDDNEYNENRYTQPLSSQGDVF